MLLSEGLALSDLLAGEYTVSEEVAAAVKALRMKDIVRVACKITQAKASELLAAEGVNPNRSVKGLSKSHRVVVQDVVTANCKTKKKRGGSKGASLPPPIVLEEESIAGEDQATPDAEGSEEET